MATDKKKGAIFRMEEEGGKLYRVMYFKNNKGGLTRSKFIREVKRKDKKRGRPTKTTRATVNKKLIIENRNQINNNTKTIRTRPTQSQPTPSKPIATGSFRKGATPNKGGIVSRSGNTQDIISKWKNMANKRK